MKEITLTLLKINYSILFHISWLFLAVLLLQIIVKILLFFKFSDDNENANIDLGLTKKDLYLAIVCGGIILSYIFN